MEKRFTETYKKVKKGLGNVQDSLLFEERRALHNAEMAY
jgi:hypothetical protein